MTEPETNSVKDVYDEAVDYYTRKGLKVAWNDWHHPTLSKYGYLFSFLTRNRTSMKERSSFRCGCPSMVSRLNFETPSEELTKKVKALPFSSCTPKSLDDLPLFAIAQRLGDSLIPDRVSPTSLFEEVSSNE